ncbi:unnamed protein product [Orchesella dallaii]|uniref:Uncharacterized protein n=1 Tax=Orchesella dallaii TaxID=48710 RepID=A0ABP1QKU1_9HEXA
MILNSNRKEDYVHQSNPYDPKVHRKSLEDPLRYHRRSSIPFLDRRPAVRFIRSVDLRKASVAGPNAPTYFKGDDTKKSILKKTNFPILVDITEIHLHSDKSGSNISSTNDDLENCRCKSDVIMEKFSKAERLSRGGLDVLTFPTSTHRIEPLSRFQGCMTIAICTIDIYTAATEYLELRKSKDLEFKAVVDVAYQMQLEAGSLQTTAKKFLALAKIRYQEWDELLKRNIEFRVDQSKLSYPIYTHKRMPESVTLLEDNMDSKNPEMIEGCVRIYRKHPEGRISLLCDVAGVDRSDVPISFQESSLEKQMEIVKILTSHGKDLLLFSNNCLNQGLDVLQDHEIDDAFRYIQRKLNSLEYDDYFDPLAALELKNGFGELTSRKAELLNTAEQIFEQCRWISYFTKIFHRYAKQSLKGKSNSSGSLSSCCSGSASKRKLLQLLGIVSVDDILILLPLSHRIAENIFEFRDLDLLHEGENQGSSFNSGLPEFTEVSAPDLLNSRAQKR